MAKDVILIPDGLRLQRDWDKKKYILWRIESSHDRLDKAFIELTTTLAPEAKLVVQKPLSEIACVIRNLQMEMKQIENWQKADNEQINKIAAAKEAAAEKLQSPKKKPGRPIGS
jgi:hypothetical protein